MAQPSESIATPTRDREIVEDNDLIFDHLPPFPSNVPTAPLLRLSLKKLLDNDAEEVERFWQSCRETGFFYLDCRGAQIETSNKRDSATDLPRIEGEVDGERLLQDAEKLFALGDKVFALPAEEKQKYDFSGQGSFFGYKAVGAGVVDKNGTRDNCEFYNVSKDDVLGFGERLPAPALLRDEAANRDLIESFMRISQAIVTLLFGILNDKLGFPPATLPGLHRLKGISGDQMRWLRTPPVPEEQHAMQKMSVGAHTDFGSLSILFNRLGGLQILPRDSERWSYVKPLKGHCVCNLGDSMSIFTAGILRSNIHRVINPPGDQADRTRMSLVYFSRPEDEVVMKVLEGSDMVDARRRTQVEFAGAEHITAKEWILRRAMGKRAGGDWKKSLGTEGEKVE